MSSLPDFLDQHLGDPCPRCERAYMWCECSLPAYLTEALPATTGRLNG